MLEAAAVGLDAGAHAQAAVGFERAVALDAEEVGVGAVADPEQVVGGADGVVGREEESTVGGRVGVGDRGGPPVEAGVRAVDGAEGDIEPLHADGAGSGHHFGVRTAGATFELQVLTGAAGLDAQRSQASRRAELIRAPEARRRPVDPGVSGAVFDLEQAHGGAAQVAVVVDMERVATGNQVGTKGPVAVPVDVEPIDRGLEEVVAHVAGPQIVEGGTVLTEWIPVDDCIREIGGGGANFIP